MILKVISYIGLVLVFMGLSFSTFHFYNETKDWQETAQAILEAEELARAEVEYNEILLQQCAIAYIELYEMCVETEEAEESLGYLGG